MGYFLEVTDKGELYCHFYFRDMETMLAHKVKWSTHYRDIIPSEIS